MQDTLVDAQVSTAMAVQVACRTAGGCDSTRISTQSWGAACSARRACPALAGGTARACTAAPTQTFDLWPVLLPGALERISEEPQSAEEEIRQVSVDGPTPRAHWFPQLREVAGDTAPRRRR